MYLPPPELTLPVTNTRPPSGAAATPSAASVLCWGPSYLATQAVAAARDGVAVARRTISERQTGTARMARMPQNVRAPPCPDKGGWSDTDDDRQAHSKGANPKARSLDHSATPCLAARFSFVTRGR